MLRERTDRQSEPGLVAFHDIQPGNGAGLFLQPRSLHGAPCSKIHGNIYVKLLADKRHKHAILGGENSTVI